MCFGVMTLRARTLVPCTECLARMVSRVTLSFQRTVRTDALHTRPRHWPWATNWASRSDLFGFPAAEATLAVGDADDRRSLPPVKRGEEFSPYRLDGKPQVLGIEAVGCFLVPGLGPLRSGGFCLLQGSPGRSGGWRTPWVHDFEPAPVRDHWGSWRGDPTRTPPGGLRRWDPPPCVVVGASLHLRPSPPRVARRTSVPRVGRPAPRRLPPGSRLGAPIPLPAAQGILIAHIRPRGLAETLVRSVTCGRPRSLSSRWMVRAPSGP